MFFFQQCGIKRQLQRFVVAEHVFVLLLVACPLEVEDYGVARLVFEGEINKAVYHDILFTFQEMQFLAYAPFTARNPQAVLHEDFCQMGDTLLQEVMEMLLL